MDEQTNKVPWFFLTSTLYKLLAYLLT